MMSSNGGREDVLQQVSHFWSMLDALSQSDPEAYRKFIEEQMKRGAEFNAPPELHSCVRTQILVSFLDDKQQQHQVRLIRTACTKCLLDKVLQSEETKHWDIRSKWEKKVCLMRLCHDEAIKPSRRYQL